MEDWELAQADLWATGIAPDGHPTRFVRHRLAAKGVVTTAHLHELPDRSRVSVGGVVTHRQRPATAGGITFMNLEDETGFANVVVSEGCWKRYQQIARSATMVVVRGRLERSREGVVNLIADRMDSVADLVIGGSAAEGGKSGEPEGERVGSPWPERPAAEGGKSGEPEGERVGSPWPERPAAEGGKSGQQQPQQAADRYLSVSPLSATTSLRSRDFR
jgi:hypothetical protein